MSKPETFHDSHWVFSEAEYFCFLHLLMWHGSCHLFSAFAFPCWAAWYCFSYKPALNVFFVNESIITLSVTKRITSRAFAPHTAGIFSWINTSQARTFAPSLQGPAPHPFSQIICNIRLRTQHQNTYVRQLPNWRNCVRNYATQLLWKAESPFQSRAKAVCSQRSPLDICPFFLFRVQSTSWHGAQCRITPPSISP